MLKAAVRLKVIMQPTKLSVTNLKALLVLVAKALWINFIKLLAKVGLLNGFIGFISLFLSIYAGSLGFYRID